MLVHRYSTSDSIDCNSNIARFANRRYGSIVTSCFFFSFIRMQDLALLLLRITLCFAMSNGLLRGDCNFSTHLTTGRVYFVYNPDYPNASQGRQSCKWIAESDYRVRLTCNMFNIPWSVNCSYDKLSVHVNSTSTFLYCGDGPFSVESTGKAMTIELSTAYWSSGTKFLCELQAVEETGKDDGCRCGWKKPTRIVGGVETGVNEYPMMVGLVDRFQRQVYCGAAIISEKHVLSAAHCVTKKDAYNVGVLVGDHDLSTGMDTNASYIYTVSRFDIYPLYSNVSLANDIAVITVNSIMTFSQEVGPACLPFQHQFDSFAGNYVDLLGWGTTEFGGMKSNTLQKVTISVITYRKCQEFYQNLSYNQLCTRGERKDACQFDSGGPVLWHNPTTKRLVLVGIISFGVACGNNEPGVSTRVGAYMDWISYVTSGTAYCKTE